MNHAGFIVGALAGFACTFFLPKLGACGDGSRGDSVNFVYQRVEECTDIGAYPPPIELVPMVSCGNGTPCCIWDGQFAGFYDYRRRTVILPNPAETPGCAYYSLAHEFVHHLLFVSGRPDWADHGAPEFARCEGIGRA